MRIEVRLCPGNEKGAGLMQDVKARELDIAAIHDVDGACFGDQQIESVNVVQLAVRDVMKLGMLPRRSSSVCIFTAALVERKCAHGNSDRHRSMVVESRA